MKTPDPPLVNAIVLATLSVLALGSAVWAAQEPAKPLPPGQSVLPAETLRAFRNGGGENLKVQIIPVTGQPFDRALRLTTLKKLPTTYSVQIVMPTVAAMKRGDVLLATFYARREKSSIESGEAQTEIIVENAGPPFHKSLEFPISVGPEWQQFQIPFVAHADLDAGKAQVCFRLGYPPQVIDIGGVEITNYGKQLAIKDLPRTRMRWAGMEEDAPWRQAAAQRIEKTRKGDLTVLVTDAAAKPLEGASVQVRMQRHAFGFGSAVSAWALTAQTPDGERYRQTVEKLFSKVVMENDLKWGNWEIQGSRQRTMDALRWLRERQIAIRGHCLVWPSWQFLPRDLEKLKDDPQALRKRVNDHIADEVAATRGSVVEWDVINEPRANHDLMDILGQDEMVQWFKLARQMDPEPVLYLNDYSILSSGGLDSDSQDHYYNTIKLLIDRGAPIGGIGMQTHFGQRPTEPERMLKILDRFASLGLAIQSTELDINTYDEEYQAQFMRDVLTTLFSHPSVEGIVMWGFWEGAHWIPNAALFRRDWSIKPVGLVWQDLVLKQWWTNADGQTDAGGRYTIRGFLGEYEAQVRHGDRTQTVRFTLPKEGTTVTVQVR